MSNIAKKAQRLTDKLVKEQAKYTEAANSIAQVLLTPSVLIGGYKMAQKLKKQRTQLESLGKTLGDRIDLFKQEIKKIGGETATKK